MKKTILGAGLGLALAMIPNLEANSQINNTATCYNIYKTKLFGGYTIIQCGTCDSVSKVKEYKNSGTCTFSSHS